MTERHIRADMIPQQLLSYGGEAAGSTVTALYIISLDVTSRSGYATALFNSDVQRTLNQTEDYHFKCAHEITQTHNLR